MRHDIAPLGDHAAAGAALSVAQHRIVALGSIVNPGVEVAQHTGVDGPEEIEHILLVIEIAVGGGILVPVDEILRHPQFLALLGQFFVSRLYAAVLVTAVDVESRQHVLLLQLVHVAVAHTDGLRSHHLATDRLSVGPHKLRHLLCRPEASRILRGPVRLVLDGDGIQFHPILSEILHIVLQILRIVGPVLALQLARGAVAVLAVDGAVGLPLRRLSPGRGEDNQSQLLGRLGRLQRLAPGVSADGDVEAHDVAAHRTA